MRIVLTGCHGTGKTTILEELKTKLPDYYFSTNITRRLIELGVPINESGDDHTQSTIMDIHLKNITRPNLVADRCVVDNFVYTWNLYDHGKVSSEVYQAQLNLIRNRVFDAYDIICYLKPEFKLHLDGVRSGSEEFRRDITERFEYVIKQYQVPHIHLTGSVRDRMEQLTIAINNHNKED
jgi:nicotinamide riboside kinase